jgi:flagellar M-ring protein FliF
MAAWQQYWQRARALAGRVPLTAWAVAGIIAASLAVVFWLEMAGPAYVVLNEGLSPADGGKVIAQLQKLGIPYQLQAAGNVILVPAPDLAQARLQLGVAQVPGDNVSTAWDRLENAPMTASDLAQSTMASQALEISLQQSIESMSGIQSAQVFLGLPADTPFLADQPKPTASVVIAASADDAQAQGPAIANLVAGAVPGLQIGQVTVETTSGVTVYPVSTTMAAATQFATVTQVENIAASRIALLLVPLVGAGNFRTNVSAALDFTQQHTHQISYGPAHLTHQSDQQSSQVGNNTSAAIGIPGALSNEPPAATTAATPGTAQAATAPPSGQPVQKTSNLDQSYVTDESDSEITTPDWAVKSVAVSVVLNQAALGKVSPDQVKTLIAGAFAYPQVNVTVVAAAFQAAGGPGGAVSVLASSGALSHAVLQLLAAAALLFGLALPFGRGLASVTFSPRRAREEAVAAPAAQAALPAPRAAALALPLRDFSDLREQAGDNIAGVARLLQSWVEDAE